jgi:hypothetical protein
MVRVFQLIFLLYCCFTNTNYNVGVLGLDVQVVCDMRVQWVLGVQALEVCCGFGQFCTIVLYIIVAGGFAFQQYLMDCLIFDHFVWQHFLEDLTI